MNKTKIEWCDYTWNPVTGCKHGCEYCYARRIAKRFSTENNAHTFTGVHPIGELHELDEPAIVTETGQASPYPFGFEPTLYRYRLFKPTTMKEPQTIFVCSMADLFGAWVPDSWIEEVFTACEKAPQHRYLFLTKNPQRYIDLARAGKLPRNDNMWYGTTANTPDEPFFYGGAWHTFVSIEPILREYDEKEIEHMCDTYEQWVIVGAETGRRSGKVTPEKRWIEAITKTCIEKNISLFLKDSLIPIVGEANIFRELPWESREARKANIDKEQDWLDAWYLRQEGWRWG